MSWVQSPIASSLQPLKAQLTTEPVWDADLIKLPILQKIAVNGYSLYPGTRQAPGLQARLKPGVTLVIGANGLGKSTLIHLIQRMLTGPIELRTQGREQLGSGQLETRPLRASELAAFASRVSDQAAQAEAELQFELGSNELMVRRRLQDLRITALTLNGRTQEVTEPSFNKLILECSGTSTTVDWLLILHYMVLYTDDRRSLVWDLTAQRRLLRLLFLPGNQTEPDSELVKKILKADSYSRNLSATLSRQEREFAQQEKRTNSESAIHEKLQTAASRLELAVQSLDESQAQLAELANERSAVRTAALRAEAERTKKLERVEQLRFNQIAQSLPSSAETARYWLTHILSHHECLVCGNDVPELSATLEKRIQSQKCVMCGSRTEDLVDRSQSLTQEMDDAQNLADEATMAANHLRRQHQDIEQQYNSLLGNIASLDQEIDDLNNSIAGLEAALPDESKTLKNRRDNLARMRRENDKLKADVVRDKETYNNLVQAENKTISKFQSAVKASFDTIARDFLLESCQLIWGQSSEQVGQIGNPIRYAVFNVDMTSGTSQAATRRDSSTQVSESQREFIDLAFRMALVAVAAEGGEGSLIVDTPESSLDAVFAPRAARVLTGFATGRDRSRLLLTSNLVDGRLIPTIAEIMNIESASDERIINLFDIAAPTAAVRSLRADYDQALVRAFDPSERPL